MVSVFRGGVTLKNVARQAYAAIATPDRWGNCNIILSERATIWALYEQPAEGEGIPYQYVDDSLFLFVLTEACYRIVPTSYRNLVWDLNAGRPQDGTQV